MRALETASPRRKVRTSTATGGDVDTRIGELNDDLRRRGAACEHGRIVLSDSAMQATREGRTAM
jgi:hypothetical protein